MPPPKSKKLRATEEASGVLKQRNSHQAGPKPQSTAPRRLTRSATQTAPPASLPEKRNHELGQLLISGRRIKSLNKIITIVDQEDLPSLTPRPPDTKSKTTLPITSRQRSQALVNPSKAKSKATRRRETVAKPVLPSPSAEVQTNSFQRSNIRSWTEKVVEDAVSQGTSASRPSPPEGSNDTAAWYRRLGYDPSETEDMTSTNDSTLSKNGESKPRNIPASKTPFLTGLTHRGVVVSSEADDRKAWITDMVFKEHRREATEEEEKNWTTDLNKCRTSDEAVFQRTIMMDVISRYDLEHTLDYICESPWQCERMPCRNGSLASRMAKPKPDLAVAFKCDSIVSPGYMPQLDDYQRYMCPESPKENKHTRAFHFFAMEVKGSQCTKDDYTGIRQNLNTASQALHNIYMFMEKAGEVEKFLNDVRFFSVVGTFSGFQFRVHRAIRVPIGMRIDPKKAYPLGFRFDKLFETQDNFSRAEISGIIRNILVEYGVKVLLPILKDAVKTTLDKLLEEQLQPLGEKRQAEGLLESFGSQRRRVDDLDLSESTTPIASQAIAA
ncbi:hypothetical protein MMC18_006247 [Xylographa bjoerkii]|nr:hypothetical protein [Xylographa bjoerkii]